MAEVSEKVIRAWLDLKRELERLFGLEPDPERPVEDLTKRVSDLADEIEAERGR